MRILGEDINGKSIDFIEIKLKEIFISVDFPKACKFNQNVTSEMETSLKSFSINRFINKIRKNVMSA